MIFTVFFAFWRLLEILTLIPILGMLAYFVHIYASQNLLTPTYILILFIVSVLGAVWAIATLFTYHRARTNALFVSLIDLCFVGALIAGVYELRGIAHYSCTSVSKSSSPFFSVTLGSHTGDLSGVSVDVDKQCAMLKAAFALGIMNCVFFFVTSLAACMVGRRGERDRKDTYVRETHYSRHGHRRSGSHRSHRSSHSGGGRRHAYV